MTIALRGAAVIPTGGQANPTTGFTFAVPATVAAGDIGIIALASRDSTGAGSIAVADTQVSWSNFGHSGTDYKLTLWWRRADANTHGVTVTVSGCVGSSGAVMKWFSGASPDDPPYANVAFEANGSGDESQAGFTPASSNSMLFAAVMNYTNDITPTTMPAFATAGATTSTICTSTGGSDCSVVLGHVLQTAGPTATGTMTWAQTDATTHSAVFALKPVTHATTGALVGAAGTLVGTASHQAPSVTHVTSGVLTGSSAVLAGTAARTRLHETDGVLAGSAAVLEGTAARTRLHESTAALAGAQAVLEGTAARAALHETTGELTGGAAELAATASHSSGPVTHETSGVLAGADAVLEAAATHIATHETTAALVGAEAALAATAEHHALLTHETTGALVGEAAVLEGAAVRNTTHEVTGELVGAAAVLSASGRNGAEVLAFGGGFYVPPGTRSVRISVQNGRIREIENLADLPAVLEEVRAEVRRKVVAKVARKAKQRAPIAVPKITVTAPPDLMATIAPQTREIENDAREYADAMARSIQARMAERDDEEIVLLL